MLGLVRRGTSLFVSAPLSGHRHHSPANLLGDHSPNSKERGGVPWHWTTGADMESAQKGDGPQAGGYCVTR
jgi:hypothetical protein